MKKIISLLAVLAIITTSFVSCTGKNDTVNDTSVDTQNEISEDTSADENIEDTDDMSNDFGGGDFDYTTDIELIPSNPDAETNDVATSDILAAVKELIGENYLPQMAIDSEILESVYGVKADWVDNFAAEMPMMSFRVDTFLAIKAKSENADDVEKALNDYRAYLLDNSLQYPMNLARVNGCRTYRIGDYVFFILLGNNPDEFLDDEAKAFEAVVLANESVVEKINELVAK